MLQFKYPGVYTQEVSSGVRTISGAPTSVALFVGVTRSGIDARPTRVQNYGDYERSFGGLDQQSSLSYSVMHFFANGGGEAFVIRVPAEDSKPASITLEQDGTSADALKLTALSSGLGGSEIYAEFDPFGIGAKPFDATDENKKIYNLSLFDRQTGRSERFGGLLTTAGNARTATIVVGDPGTGSKLVKLTNPSFGLDRPEPTGSVYAIGTAPTAGTFAGDVVLQLSVDVLKDDGSAGASLSNHKVRVFKDGSAKPTTAFELVAKMAAAINAELRDDDTAKTFMEGVGIEAELLENGTLFRLRTTAPGPKELSKRLSDAKVSIAIAVTPPPAPPPAPPPPPGPPPPPPPPSPPGPPPPPPPPPETEFTTAYGVTKKVENPSRYRLGAQYGSSFTVSASVAAVAGKDHGQAKTDDLKDAVMALETPDPFFNLLCLPDLVRPAESDPNALHHGSAVMGIYGEGARVCAEKFAFMIIDPLPGLNDVGAAEAWKTTGFTFQTSHAAAYFPNIRVDDPLVPGSIRSHPPSGALAGVYARTDGNVGVWQAPAGVEASLNGVYGPSVVLSDGEHGILNPLGLNVIRLFPIYNTVSFGARTVDGSNAMASEWKYIPVRRTALYILRSLSEGLRWAVHKPNGDTLWAELRMNVTAFMQGLFRAGAFKGTSPRDAFFVLCDASTTTQTDIDLGVVNIVIGFAPLKPAEFVVITLKQIAKPAV